MKNKGESGVICTFVETKLRKIKKIYLLKINVALSNKFVRLSLVSKDIIKII